MKSSVGGIFTTRCHWIIHIGPLSNKKGKQNTWTLPVPNSRTTPILASISISFYDKMVKQWCTWLPVKSKGALWNPFGPKVHIWPSKQIMQNVIILTESQTCTENRGLMKVVLLSIAGALAGSVLYTDLDRKWHWVAQIAKCANHKKSGIKEPSASSGSQVEMVFTSQHKSSCQADYWGSHVRTSKVKKMVLIWIWIIRVCLKPAAADYTDKCLWPNISSFISFLSKPLNVWGLWQA